VSEFCIGDEVCSTQEALDYGAVERPVKARVTGIPRNQELIKLRLKGQLRDSVWHRDFFQSKSHEIPKREDMWGDQKR